MLVLGKEFAVNFPRALKWCPVSEEAGGIVTHSDGSKIDGKYRVTLQNTTGQGTTLITLNPI